MLRPRTSARSTRPLTFAPDINNLKILHYDYTIIKKRSKSSPNQIHQTVKQVIASPTPISRRRNYSERSIPINYKDESYFYKHLHTQRIWKIGKEMGQLTNRKNQPGKG